MPFHVKSYKTMTNEMSSTRHNMIILFSSFSFFQIFWDNMPMIKHIMIKANKIKNIVSIPQIYLI